MGEGEKPDFDWSVRARAVGPAESKVYARNNVFSLGQQASMKESDPFPSATEVLLGALAGDLLFGFRVEAARRGVEIDALEVSASGKLDNMLVHLGVIGERGHAGFKTIDLTFYATIDAPEEEALAIWNKTLERSPLAATLQRAAEVRFNLRLLP